MRMGFWGKIATLGSTWRISEHNHLQQQIYSAMKELAFVLRFSRSTWLDRLFEALKAKPKNGKPASNRKDPKGNKEPKSKLVQAAAKVDAKETLVLGTSTVAAWTDKSKTVMEVKFVGLHLLDTAPLVMGNTLYFNQPISEKLTWTVTPVYLSGKEGSTQDKGIGVLNKSNTIWSSTFPKDWELANLAVLRFEFNGDDSILPELPDGGAWVLIDNLDSP